MREDHTRSSSRSVRISSTHNDRSNGVQRLQPCTVVPWVGQGSVGRSVGWLVGAVGWHDSKDDKDNSIDAERGCRAAVADGIWTTYVAGGTLSYSWRYIDECNRLAVNSDWFTVSNTFEMWYRQQCITYELGMVCSAVYLSGKLGCRYLFLDFPPAVRLVFSTGGPSQKWRIYKQSFEKDFPTINSDAACISKLNITAQNTVRFIFPRLRHGRDMLVNSSSASSCGH